ncbi:hypothetical protein [Streptomyces sp. TRM68367]|uniref:hypothetical protein n=1 Tax=Streptomyces sp. TRM68367 TaxID=2758415 RepID=UPI00165ABE16|nr:hypothetical protein [Streptomyces sp. TRM68367]MBC9727752.1 hypothetical protein [Streptomyces sp. TRM68367]
MRNSQPLLRSALTGAAAAALPLALAAGPAAAGPGISVSTTGSTVSVTTSACTQINGSWGTASLLNSSQANFAQGRQVSLSGTSALQSAAWSNVSPGTYTVIVMCSNNQTAGTQSVIVSPASTPTISATASASPRGVMGGVGGAARDYGTVTLVAGGALVGTGIAATAWYLRRRNRPYRL